MCRNSHDSAGSVGSENVVRNENRNFFSVNGVDAFNAFEHYAGFVFCKFGTLEVGFFSGFCLICSYFVDVFEFIRPFFNICVFRAHYHIGRAEKGVAAGGINGENVTEGGVEVNFRAGGTTDPVFLGSFYSFDIIDFVKVIDKALGIFGDFKHPLGFDFVNNFASAAFTNAVYYFFVRKNNFAAGAPVYVCLFFISKAAFEKLDKNPLGPFIIVGVGGVDFSVPIEGKSKRFKLGLEMVNVVFGYDFGVDMVFDCKVFGGKTESVPTHRIEDIIALHSLFSGNDIQSGVGTGMSYMKSLSGRIGEFNKSVEFGLGVIGGCGIGFLFVPDVLPLLFNCGIIIAFHFSVPPV